MRFGTAALFGRTNVGKSTFLNAALGEPLAITSPLPQTTRDALLGVVNAGDAQIAFLDTPGLHRPRSELGRRMNAAALEAARGADVVVFMTDTHALRAGAQLGTGAQLPDEELEVLRLVPESAKLVLVINKVDRLRSKPNLLPLIEAYSKERAFEAIIPACVLQRSDVERILGEIVRCLPEGPAGYPEDTLTDRPLNYFVREYVREQVLLQAAGEVPYAAAVSVDQAQDHGRVFTLKVTLHVEKEGQRKILIGTGGERIKEIGIRSRERIEALVGKQVHIELFVRLTPRWKNMPRQLAELGYDASSSESGDPLGEADAGDSEAKAGRGPRPKRRTPRAGAPKRGAAAKAPGKDAGKGSAKAKAASTGARGPAERGAKPAARARPAPKSGGKPGGKPGPKPTGRRSR
jgi:GTP-binding protein Era